METDVKNTIAVPITSAVVLYDASKERRALLTALRVEGSESASSTRVTAHAEVLLHNEPEAPTWERIDADAEAQNVVLEILVWNILSTAGCLKFREKCGDSEALEKAHFDRAELDPSKTIVTRADQISLRIGLLEERVGALDYRVTALEEDDKHFGNLAETLSARIEAVEKMSQANDVYVEEALRTGIALRERVEAK